MNDEDNEKIITWRKLETNDKPININNKKTLILKDYSQKEKEYINKYLNISKSVLNEEKIYNIIIRFNFNDQLILAEIFQILDEATEKDKEKNKLINKSVFVPYKTKYGIEKSIYSLKAENKPKRKELSKEKKIYKYENNSIAKINLGKNENNSIEQNNKEENSDKVQIYPKRFSNFNKIIQDYQHKKYKDENNNFYKKLNKINYKNKTLGGKINNNKNHIVPYKYYNSKKLQKEENNEVIINNENEKPPKIKQEFVKENIINLEYINLDSELKNLLNSKNKTAELSISNTVELAFEGNSTKKLEIENNINESIKQELNTIKTNLYDYKSHINNNFYKMDKNTVLNNYINKKNEQNKNIKNTINKDNNFKYYYPKMNMNNYYNNNCIPSNYLENYKNNFYQKSFNYNIIDANNNNNIYNNLFINNYNKCNNFFLNQKIGIPLYFYPYYHKSNNIMMSKYISMQAINNNNFLFNSFYSPQMIRVYYQGINNNEKLKSFNNKNILTPINPMMYYLLMRKIGMNFIPNQNINKNKR